MKKIILYHGSNIVVENPKILQSDEYLILVQDFILRQAMSKRKDGHYLQ